MESNFTIGHEYYISSPDSSGHPEPMDISSEGSLS